MAIRPNFAQALFLGAFLSLAVPAESHAHQEGSPEVQEVAKPQVQVSTLMDVKAFVPGQMAHLIVVLDVPKDWHIYWKNQGAGGLPTQVSLTGPKGWKIEAPRFPGPVLHKDELGDLTYILKGKVACFVPIIPPDNAKVGQEVEFDLKVDWLMCKGSCHPGGVEQKVKAQVASGLPSRNSARHIAALRSYLPRRGLSMTGVGVKLSGDTKSAELTFHSLDSRDFEFFPYTDSPMVVGVRKSESQATDHSSHTFSLKPAAGKQPKEIEVNGVLRMKIKERVLYYELSYKGMINLEPAAIPAGHGSLPELPQKPNGH